MALFEHRKKKTPEEEAADRVQLYFDEHFRKELQNLGRTYFEKIIKEDAERFKQSLDGTIDEVREDLKDHITKRLDPTIAQVNKEIKLHIIEQLDTQFVEYTKAVKDAQDTALQSLSRTTEALHEQHKQLSAVLQQNVANQSALLINVFEENRARFASMKDAQDAALQSLAQTAQAIETERQQLSEVIQKNAAVHEQKLVDAFEQNMAIIVERYLLGAVGEEFDLEAQMPSIIKQLEANKQAMADDMKL
ncbi:MAG: hypothetical protein ACSLEY_00360 [Candidatus Saccharimonadales bacterium]